MIKRVVGDLGAILADAQERGLVAQNVVRSLGRHKRRQDERRQKAKLKVGVDIPAREEIASIIANLRGRWRPLILTAIFTGLRASELRWPAVGGRGFEEARASCPAKGRQVQQDR